MEIRDAQEEKEHRYIDMGEEFFCPICGAIWLKEIEGDVTFGNCEHLRFSLHSENDSNFDFFGDWDWDGFQDMVEARDDDTNMMEVVYGISHPSIDKAILWVWHDDPMYHPWMIWGYSQRS
jgi:hypothetical protein